MGNDGSFQAIITLPTTWPDSGEAIVEPTLFIALLAADDGEVLATASYSNDAEQAVPEGMDTPAP
jgi:hypothetical protein